MSMTSPSLATRGRVRTGIKADDSVCYFVTSSNGV